MKPFENHHTIFDFDGPVVESLGPAVLHLKQTISPEKSIEEILAEQKTIFKKPVAGTDPTYVQWQQKILDIQQFNEGMLAHGAKLRSDLALLLRMMKLNGWQFGIVTNGTHSYVHTLLSQDPTITKGLFHPILTIEDHPSKTERITQTAKQWKTDPTHITFVTDTANDVLEAREVLPMKNIIGVAFGPHTSEDLQEAGCENIIEKFNIPGLVKKLKEVHGDIVKQQFLTRQDL